MDLTIEDKIFLKGLKKMKEASEEDIKTIYLLYRKLINKPELVKEYESCNCPSILREFHFELSLWATKNKNLLK